MKQGGVLSAKLSSLYMNCLWYIDTSGYGCYIVRMAYGGIGYADDLILLVPTQFVLRKKICEEYARECNIVLMKQK